MTKYFLVLTAAALALGVSAAQAKPPKPTSSSTASTSRPNTQARPPSTYVQRTRAQVNFAQAQNRTTQLNREARQTSQTLNSVTNSRAELQARFNRSNNPAQRELFTTQIRGMDAQIRRLEARLGNTRRDLTQAYRQRNAARRTLKVERANYWNQRANERLQANPQPPRARTIRFADTHLGPTGSGRSRPPLGSLGVLKTQGRASVVLPRRPMGE